MRWMVLLTALFIFTGCASTQVTVRSGDEVLREVYRKGYEDGVRDALAAVERKNAEYFENVMVRKVRIPGTVTGNAYLPAHDEYILSTTGVRDAFTPLDSERIARGLRGE